MTGFDFITTSMLSSVIEWVLSVEPEWPTIVMLAGCASLMSILAFVMTHDAQALAPPTVVAILVALCAIRTPIAFTAFCGSTTVRMVVCDLSSVAILYGAALIALEGLRGRIAWATATGRLQVWTCALSCWFALACAFAAHESRHDSVAAGVGLLSAVLFVAVFGVVPNRRARLCP